MRRKEKFIMIGMVAVLVLSSCSKKETQMEEPQPVAAVNTVNTVDPAYLADAKELIKTLEETHPAFVRNMVPEDYEEKKQSYLSASSDSTVSKSTFAMLTRKFLTSFEDAHTHVGYYEPCIYIKLGADAKENELWLADSAEESKNAKIIQIGGVNTDVLIQLIDSCYAAENDTAREINYGYYIEEKQFLEYAGCKFDDKGIDVTFERDGKQNTVNYHWIMPEDSNQVSDETEDAEIDMQSTRIKDDILYVDWNSCMVKDSVYSSNIDALHSAMKDGITKVIIDVRDNGGGNASFCRDYLKELGMQEPEYGFLLRHSPLSAKTRGESKKSGADQSDRNMKCAKINNKIKLVVLVNENTFSAATMLGVYVQDGKLGTVIGRKSQNSPTCYSDIVTYEMKNSGIPIYISTSYLMRPDKNADQKTLVPDIETSQDEDSLQIAESFLEKEN